MRYSTFNKTKSLAPGKYILILNLGINIVCIGDSVPSCAVYAFRVISLKPNFIHYIN